MSAQTPKAIDRAFRAALSGRPAFGKRACVVWLGLCSLCWEPSAYAQSAPKLDVRTFAVPPQPALTFSIPDPVPRGHGRLFVGLSSDFSTQLLNDLARCEDSQPADAACAPGQAQASAHVPWLVQGSLLVGVSVFDFFSFGLSLPLVLTRAELNGAGANTRSGPADIGAHISGAFIATKRTRVGWQLSASLPTASNGTFAGEPFSLTPGFAISHELRNTTLALQLGYHLRKRQVIVGIERDDELLAKLGVHHALASNFAAIAELRTQLGIGGLHLSRAEIGAEIDVGARIGNVDFGELDVGVGTAAWPGERGVGAPNFRVFLSLRRAFGARGCSSGPEDFDGFEDADDCADLDNDRDGVLDADDACRNDAEDHDGFRDEDGCPDSDNDADGLADARDVCPDDSEDADGFEDQDGCPEPDNDQDGVADGADRCRLDPEDRDSFEDDDGCPEVGPEQQIVTRSGARLLLSNRIYFEDESDTLRAVSTPQLDALAATFKELPGNPRLRVEGYSDDKGTPAQNVDLSYRRARAVVEYLKRQGIAAARLEYVGRGKQNPLGPNDTPEGRALNRRVEFVLVER
ncbi:MAG TPA: OmpA family protein [Polyangiales bacterium]|nr:OmpA family protein [Polyangiales bacterium]